ncbi:MAG: hypothetical protein HFE34_03390 [Clostridia bacterium]|nr:hypothetical protein [Clostridia bacterium]
MDDILEFLVENVAELYFEFFQNLLPDKKISKGKRLLLTILCAIVSLGMLACIISGICLIINGATAEVIIGIVLISLSGVGMLAHIFIAIYNSKKKKNKLEPLDKDSLDKLNK